MEEFIGYIQRPFNDKYLSLQTTKIIYIVKQ